MNRNEHLDGNGAIQTEALFIAPSSTVVAAPRDAAPLVAAWLADRNARCFAAYRGDIEDFRAFLGCATVDTAAARLLEIGHWDE